MKLKTQQGLLTYTNFFYTSSSHFIRIIIFNYIKINYLNAAAFDFGRRYVSDVISTLPYFDNLLQIHFLCFFSVQIHIPNCFASKLDKERFIPFFNCITL